VHEVGRHQARAGSLTHTLVLEAEVRYRAEVRELAGEPIVLLWARPVSGAAADAAETVEAAEAAEAVEDVLRVETAEGGVRRLRWYYFCPQTMTEVAEQFGLPVRTHGHRLAS
jgi:RNA polymerase sigma-70 factor (ECF subfamily)